MFWLDPHDDGAPFPDVERALREPDGLLAAGGELSPRRLLNAYRPGSFPWYGAGRPILWWSPDPRGDGLGSWLSVEMFESYCVLLRLGFAHSAECWHDGKLVCGLYGIAIGKVFFGESMFARRSDASKVAFVHLLTQLKETSYRLIDCQIFFFF